MLFKRHENHLLKLKSSLFLKDLILGQMGTLNKFDANTWFSPSTCILSGDVYIIKFHTTRIHIPLNVSLFGL